MARVVRKVSGKAVRGQKKNKGLLKSKRFWIICVVALILVVGVGITIGVLVNNDDTTEEAKVEDYFGMTQTYTDKNNVKHDVNFEKMSYSGIRMHSNPNFEDSFIEYMFIFAVDLSTFYPENVYDEDGEVAIDKVSSHEGIFKALIELQYQIDVFNSTNEEDYDVKLYIVDTTLDLKNENSTILVDDYYGGDIFESKNVFFSLVTEDGFVENYEGYKGGIYNDNIDLHCASYVLSEFQGVVNNSINYMNLGFKNQEKE